MKLVPINIRIFYLVNFLAGFVFWYATEKLFMKTIGISDFGIAVNAVVFLVVILLFDVPSGVLADKWNRKYTLMLSMAALAVSSFVLGMSHNLSMYVVGTALFGGYVVLSSGTFQAMMYDCLAENELEKQYDRFQGRAYGLFLTGIGISSLAGGYIASYAGLRQTFFYSIVPPVLAILILSGIHEPVFHKQTSDSKFWTHIRQSARVVSSQPVIFHLALFLVIGNMLRSTQNEFGGLYYIGLSLSTISMGYVNAGKWISGAVGQFIAPIVGREKAIALTPWFFISFAAFSVIMHLPSLIFFFFASALFSLVANQVEAAVQEQVSSNIRATTLSLFSFCTNIIMVPLSLVFGWVAQNSTVFRGYQLFAVIGLGYALFWTVKSRYVIIHKLNRLAT